MSYKSMTTETAKGGYGIMLWVIVFLVCAGLISLAVGLSRPVWLGFEQRAFVASHQYIETKRTAIADTAASCMTLPAGPQRDALRRIIQSDSALIPAGQVPSIAQEC